MKTDVEQFEEFSDSVKRGLADGIKPDVVGYNLMLEKIAAVSPEAAAYARFQAPTLSSFFFHSKLMHAFAWGETPQGSDYWQDIFLAMGADDAE